MAYDEKERTKPALKPHSVSMDDRCRLSVTGVDDVESFDEATIIMNTSQGNLIVRGSGLHMEKMSLETGEVLLSGRVDSLDYEDTPEARGFFARLFR